MNRRFDSKPTSLFCAFCMLRTKRPAPTSVISARATSETTGMLPSGPRDQVALPVRPPALRLPAMSALDALMAGARPKMIPVSSARPRVNIRTWKSSARTRSLFSMNGGRNAQSMRRPAKARSSPAAPPERDSTALSVKSWRTSRTRLAPTALRMLISRSRRAPLASNRLARLTQAIRRMSPTTPIMSAPASTN